MTPYYSDESVTLYHGDCREITAWLEADVLVTDPPYGRAWKRGDTNSARGWSSDRHGGIANDGDTAARDHALEFWGDRAGVVFGDLLVAPPAGARHVLIYDKGSAAGFAGAIGGYRRNVEAVYLIGRGWASGLGGRGAVLGSAVRHVGTLAKNARHPHAKPLDVMEQLIEAAPPGVIADPFAGSGSTLVAARSVGRKAIGVELEERYCEVIAQRLAQGALDFGGAA